MSHTCSLTACRQAADFFEEVQPHRLCAVEPSATNREMMADLPTDPLPRRTSLIVGTLEFMLRLIDLRDAIASVTVTVPQ